MAATHRVVKPQPTRQGRATEARILDAATQLFYEKGYHATTMREVGAVVGIKAPSLYNHYAAKEDLLVRIASGVMEELLAGGRQAVAAHSSPREQLRALVTWHVTYHAENRFRARVADEQLHAIREERRAPVLETRDAYEQLFEDVLEAGRLAHGWRVRNNAVIAFGIAGMCTSVDTWFREDGPLTAAEIGELFAEFVLAALAAPAS